MECWKNGILGTVHLKLLATELLNEAIPIRVYEDRDRFELARIGIPETVYCYRNWFEFTIRRRLTDRMLHLTTRKMLLQI